MSISLDRQRPADAQQAERGLLCEERARQRQNSDELGSGVLASSPLATATAISALVLAEQGGTSSGLPAFTPGVEPSHLDEIYRNDLSEQIVQSIQWLARQQNDDGGWGDTVHSPSNLPATLLAQAAFHLTGVPAKYQGLLERAEAYVTAKGGVATLKKLPVGDKLFAAPVLANCALADMVPWKKVPALPFEWACLPEDWRRLLRRLPREMPVVRTPIPAMLAVGLAKRHHCPPANPLRRWLRSAAKPRSLALLTELQSLDGSFSATTPLTSCVVMSLASIGETEHVVVRRGIEFLLASVRPEGSWPIGTFENEDVPEAEAARFLRREFMVS